MPIRINLMAEAQAAEEARRRNPVKLGIWIAAFCVILVGLWILKMQMDIYFANVRLAGLNAQWDGKDGIKAQYDRVISNQARMADVEKKMAALDHLSTNRFLWGSVLNALQQTVVDHVAVTRIAGDQTYLTQEDSLIGSGANKKTIPGGVIEKIKLTIEGRDFDPAHASYSKYKDKLCNFDFFVKHLGRNDGFTLQGTLGPLSLDPQNPATQFQNFTLAAHFPDSPPRRTDQ
jgi:hypothetical protein